MSSTWTLASLLDRARVRAQVFGDADTVLDGLSFDRSRLTPGDLFCCIAGSRSDDHDHAAEIAQGGAAALLVERRVDAPRPQAVVESVRATMGLLADAFWHRPSDAVLVVAVTGTNGKTTTTHLVESICRAAGVAAGIIGTMGARFGEHRAKLPIGTPEAIDLQRELARFRDLGADLAAVEATSIGIHKGRLIGTRIAAAGFTNLTQDHIDEYHGTMEAYFEAKAMLFGAPYTSRPVVNVDDEYGGRLAERCAGLELLRCSSRGAGAEVVARSIAGGPDGTRFELLTPAGAAAVRMPLVGRYNVDNALLAAGIALHVQIPLEMIARGLESIGVVRGRLEPVAAGQPFTVLVDYAHTPDAIGHATRAAKELARGRLIVVFGCGGDRDRTKRPLMGRAATEVADLTVITSDNPRTEDPAAIIDEIVPGARHGGGRFVVEPDRRAAIAAALSEAREGDVVLIAGKGHETGQEIGTTIIPFDDREVAAELLGARDD